MNTKYKNVKAFSGNYSNADYNFVIQNLKGNEEMHNDYYATFCVLENIISRGTYTMPSCFLMDKYGKPNNDFVSFSPSKDLKWDRTIKGFMETGNNPAKAFYDSLKSVSSKGLFMPETYFSDIFPEHSNYNKSLESQMVDFYCEKEKLVIEIDGSQHTRELQLIKDQNRDEELNRFGIKVRRILPSEISKTELLDNIEETAKKHNIKVPQSVINYTAIFRFQVLILELLKSGVISLTDKTWDFCITCIDSIDLSVFKDAIDDVFLWLDHLLALRDMKYVKPIVRISNGQGEIKIDFSVCTPWTDEHLSNNSVIYVRNAYLQEKNYFRVSKADPIKYAVNYFGKKGSNEHLKFVLKNIFGFDEFREGQEKIVVHALSLLDTIGILPTGSGKSLCYQLACLLQPCVNICVEPIKALMYDQSDNLKRIRIDRIEAITSDLDQENRRLILDRFGCGEFMWIFVSPERLQSQTFRESLYGLNINMNLPFAYVVIDEAHCMSEWGHDFRTSYLNLTNTVRQYCPTATLLGLTATASRNTLRNLQIDFGISDRRNIVTASTYERKELRFDVRITDSKISELIKRLSALRDSDPNVFIPSGENTKSMIIFTPKVGGRFDGILATKDRIDRMVNGLEWFAGSSPKRLGRPILTEPELAEHNKDVQDRFKNNEFAVLLATKAFGMGIDKPNIRYTIHYGLPSSLEALYQEAGRAGRDGNPALCTVIFNRESKPLAEKIQRIFEKDATIPELYKISDEAEFDGKDLYTQLFFIKNGLTEKEIELKVVKKLLAIIKPDIKKVPLLTSDFGSDSSKISFETLEKILYHLRLLGVVEDWTIDGMRLSNTPIVVDFANYSEESVKENLLNCINAYEPEFTLDNKIKKYEKYRKLWTQTDDYIINAYSVHWEWYYDNIVYSRRIALKNLKDQCELFDPEHPEIFKKNLESYFKVDDQTDYLEELFDSGLDINLWKKVLNKDTIKNGVTTELEMQLRRFLESTKNNVGFNFIYGALRIINGNVEADDISFMSESLGDLKQRDWEDICSYFAELVRDVISEEQKELFAKAFIDSNNNSKSIEYVYLKFNDNYSLNMIMKNAMKKIGAAWEEV